MSAALPSPDLILKDLRSVCTELKAQLEEARKAPAGEGRDELLEKCSLSILKLRRSNRAAHDVAHGWIGESEAARQKTDQVFLRLQNLQYEKNHLKKEIQLCEDFTVRNVEGLVEKEVFLEKGPENLVSTTSPHTLELNRLSYEMEERKRLVGNMKTQEMRKKVYESSILAKQTFLGSLSSHLEKVSTACQPVVKEFQKEVRDSAGEGTSYEELLSLPSPLYTLYYQLISLQDAFKLDLKTKAEGDFAAAQVLLGFSSEEEAPGYRAAKRAKATTEDLPTVDANPLSLLHPLHVSMFISESLSSLSAPPPTTDPEAPPPLGIEITFHFLPRLGVVTVTQNISPQIELAPWQTSSILSDLYPGDAGVTSPNPASDLLDATFDPTIVGRPYAWAQSACGLKFLPATTEGISHHLKMQRDSGENTFLADVLLRVAERVRSAIVLAKFLQSLQSLSIPSVPGYESSSPPANLSVWRKLDDQMIDDGEVVDPRQRFEFTVAHATSKLSGTVAIGAAYPAVAPSFTQLQISRGDGVQTEASALEEEVNVQCVDEIRRDSTANQSHVFAIQFHRLISSLRSHTA